MGSTPVSIVQLELGLKFVATYRQRLSRVKSFYEGKHNGGIPYFSHEKF